MQTSLKGLTMQDMCSQEVLWNRQQAMVKTILQGVEEPYLEGPRDIVNEPVL